MKRKLTAAMVAAGSLALLAEPALAADPTRELGIAGKIPTEVAISSIFVFICGCLVFFMQGGLALVEIGFIRGKNAGSIVPKFLVNLGICAAVFWAVGFGVAFGDGNSFTGTSGWFVSSASDFWLAWPRLETGVTVHSLWFFQFAFAAITLAIIWGTTLERLKFGVYVIYAVVFSAVIYPLVAHWLFSDGFLRADLGAQDFAGSIVIDVTAAAAALAVLLLLGPRRGKYGTDGKPRAIPGHNMPLFGTGIFILFLGWFGFNPGSTLNGLDGRFGEIGVITLLAGGFGVLAAVLLMWLRTGGRTGGTFDIGMSGNGAIAGLVAITGPSGYIDMWAAPIIGAVAGVIVVEGVLLIDRKLDDPIGVLSAHGLAGIWGALSLGLFAVPELAKYNGVGRGGLLYGEGIHQLWVQAVAVVVVFAFVFASSFIVFWVTKQAMGLRVSAEQENAGLDISEHGMYGYPEQFIPAPELMGYGAVPEERVGTGPLSDPEVTA
ncbi:MAG: ammonium transporter [Actinomycetes bacterium]